MHTSPERASQILNELQSILQNQEPASRRLRRMWMTMAYIQSFDLANSLSPQLDDRVFSGPFKGMRITPALKEGSYCPILLGTYEAELHHIIENIIAQPYQQILNIGCAFGYYSVGLALRMPRVTVYAFDILEREQQRCREMATLNNVNDRVIISGLFQGENFSAYADKKTLLLMDIEGAEEQLLDPVLYPALQKMDILVELHDVFDPKLSTLIPDRFAPTHDIEIIYNRTTVFDFAPFFGANCYIDPFNCLIANWENRGGPTPWAHMRVKSI